MNTLFALALAFTLNTAPINDDKNTSRETSTYVVTDKFAIWLTDAGKLKLSMGQQNVMATIKLTNGSKTLYKNSIDLRKGAQQSFDLSQIGEGTYQIEVTIGDEVTTKTVQIGQVNERTVRLS
jgi:hypothetical protein